MAEASAYKPVALSDIKEVDEESDIEDVSLDGRDLEKQHLQQLEQGNDDHLEEPRIPRFSSLRQLPKWKRFNTYGAMLQASCIAALPKFCQPGGFRTKNDLSPTAYLDALRGYAAWIVFNYHSFNTYDPSWRQQPFINILFAGDGMVSLFFVISGYVLSYRILKHIRNQESIPLVDSLASSMFRRYLRLYGSTALALLIAMIMVRLGWYNGVHTPLYKDTFFEQLFDWLYDLLFFLNPFGDIRGYVWSEIFDTKYLAQMWTIPVEYRGSMILFAFCTAVCKLSTRYRMILTWMVIAVCYLWNGLYVANFLYGLFIADVSLGRNPERLARGIELPQSQAVSTENSKKQSLNAKIGYSVLLLIGLFLLAQPEHTSLGVFGDFPWAFLKSFIPFYYTDGAATTWWLSFGAFATVFALDSYPTLQRPLEWGFSQYVGELSFGIYAMHVPLEMGMYKTWLEPLREKYIGNSPISYIPGFIVTTLVVFAAADYFNRLDKRVVSFGRWVQVKTFMKWQN